MTQRTIAALIALPLTVGLLLVTVLHHLLFVVYSPGPTFNTLGDTGSSPIIQVQGHPTYPDTGDLRFVTVQVTPPGAHTKSDGETTDGGVNLFELVGSWFNKTQAVYPYYNVYPKGETAQESQEEGTVDMVTAQDTATAVALKALGYHVGKSVEVYLTADGTPAQGKLMPHDIFLSANGTKVRSTSDLTAVIKNSTGPIRFRVQRAGKPVEVTITPQTVSGRKQIGIQLGIGYKFPFQVSFDIDSNIGGPSAGTMFALALYDTLTPGSLTGGGSIAGTGTIAANGTVGAIGGIQQKIAGSRRDGAQLFLVPAPNCADAVGAHNGDMRLIKITKFSDALSSVQAWSTNHDATLPTCAGS